MVESISKSNVGRDCYLLDSNVDSNTLENIRTLWMSQRCVEEPVSLSKNRSHDQNAWRH